MLKWETGLNVDKFELILLMPLSLYISFLFDWFFYFKIGSFFFLLKVYRLTGYISLLCFKGYGKLSSGVKVEWNNRWNYSAC